MDQQTVTTVLTGAAVLIGLAGYLHTIKRDLQQENVATRTELGARIAKVETGLGARIAKVEADLGARIDKAETGLGARIDKVEARLGNIEQRTFDLSTRLPPVAVARRDDA